MITLQSIKLNDIIDFNPKVKLEKSDPYSFIPMENITPDMKFVSDVEKKEWQGQSSSKFESGDILFARIYPCLDNRKIAVAKTDGKGFGSTEFFVLRAKEGIADQNFVYYLSKSDLIVQTAINSYVGASGRQRADLKFIRNSQFDLPTYDNQKKIAAILSTYDDLIDVNKKRIEILENTATELYKEWFVRFRFSSNEDIIFEKGIPKGWEFKKLIDISDITYGYAFDSSRFNIDGVGKKIVRIRNIPDSKSLDFTDEVVDDRYIVNNGDFLIGMDGFFHMNRWYDGESYLVQRTCRISAKNKLFQGYLRQAMRVPISFYQATIMGATVGHLGAKHLSEINILVPNQSFMRLVEELNELDELILSLELMNRKLKNQANVLLPRLMSGKLSVADLGVQYPPSMQTSDEAEEK